MKYRFLYNANAECGSQLVLREEVICMPYCFKPIINQNSKILILGTLPGTLSIEINEYYADPQNQFWNIIYSVYNVPVNNDYNQKCEFLKKNRIALWDVLSYADREGALDIAIRNGVPNDFTQLFANHPNIEYVIFNGSKAEKIFKKHFNMLYKTKCCKRVSSSSSTPGRYVKTLSDKIIEWKEAINNATFPLSI